MPAHVAAAAFFVGAWWLSQACACAAVWQPLFMRRPRAANDPRM